MAEEDLVFAKNRHFFGGIEPSNLHTFRVYTENGKVKIETQLPPNTVVNGQTLCVVKGAVIRRKTSGYPENEFDGERVADAALSGTMVDTTASASGTYYYAAFPYSAQGVYNRNKANRAVLNPPRAMKAFSAQPIYTEETDDVKVELATALPSDADGAVIRKSVTGTPASETDGVAVMNITEDGTYTDDEVEAGGVYYYAAFPYDENGTISQSKATAVVRKENYRFGYDLILEEADPEERVVYPSDVDNAEFVPGNWGLAPGKAFLPRPCILKFDGTVLGYLDPEDYGKFEDGSPAPVGDGSCGGNVMMEWPKIYTKRWEENGIYHFRCSDAAPDEDYKCWSSYDRNGREIGHFYTAVYGGTVISGKLRSLSGQEFSPVSYDEAAGYARANGEDWDIGVLADHLLIQDLLVMLAKSTDGQKAYGSGRVFGMENPWEGGYRYLAGWVNDHGVQKVKLTRGKQDGSEAADYNASGTWYLTVSEASPAGVSGGYIRSMKTESFGRLPVETGGSCTTYECDGLWFDNSGIYCAAVGGKASNGKQAGAFFTLLSGVSVCGAALSCKPSVK